jgi:hypothetical protein
MVCQVKAKPAAAEALLTSMKTTFERHIWRLRITAAGHHFSREESWACDVSRLGTELDEQAR